MQMIEQMKAHCLFVGGRIVAICRMVAILVLVGLPFFAFAAPPGSNPGFGNSKYNINGQLKKDSDVWGRSSDEAAFAHGFNCMCMGCQQVRSLERQKKFQDELGVLNRHEVQPLARGRKIKTRPRFPLEEGVDIAIRKLMSNNRKFKTADVIEQLEMMQSANDVALPYQYTYTTTFRRYTTRPNGVTKTTKSLDYENSRIKSKFERMIESRVRELESMTAYDSLRSAIIDEGSLEHKVWYLVEICAGFYGDLKNVSSEEYGKFDLKVRSFVKKNEYEIYRVRDRVKKYPKSQLSEEFIKRCNYLVWHEYGKAKVPQLNDDCL